MLNPCLHRQRPFVCLCVHTMLIQCPTPLPSLCACAALLMNSHLCIQLASACLLESLLSSKHIPNSLSFRLCVCLSLSLALLLSLKSLAHSGASICLSISSPLSVGVLSPSHLSQLSFCLAVVSLWCVIVLPMISPFFSLPPGYWFHHLHLHSVSFDFMSDFPLPSSLFCGLFFYLCFLSFIFHSELTKRKTITDRNVMFVHVSIIYLLIKILHKPCLCFIILQNINDCTDTLKVCPPS